MFNHYLGICTADWSKQLPIRQNQTETLKANLEFLCDAPVTVPGQIRQGGGQGQDFLPGQSPTGQDDPFICTIKSHLKSPRSDIPQYRVFPGFQSRNAALLFIISATSHNTAITSKEQCVIVTGRKPGCMSVLQSKEEWCIGSRYLCHKQQHSHHFGEALHETGRQKLACKNTPSSKVGRSSTLYLVSPQPITLPSLLRSHVLTINLHKTCVYDSPSPKSGMLHWPSAFIPQATAQPSLRRSTVWPPSCRKPGCRQLLPLPMECCIVPDYLNHKPQAEPSLRRSTVCI